MPDEMIVIHILDQEYTIKLGNQKPEEIQKLAAFVDKRAREFRDLFPQLSYQKILILICLNVSDELIKLRQEWPGDPQRVGEMLTSLKDILLN